jgi:5-methylcytosine-specific restriction endonuclease McrBC regulatory subunit McrC
MVVLEQRDPLPSHETYAESEAVELSVPTEKLWERIVHESLQHAGFEGVEAQARTLTSDPWLQNPVAVSRTAPDNVAHTASDIFVVDAKYKTPSVKEGPSRDDQYQMFAYSHLVRDLPRQVRAAVLVYPGGSASARWLRGPDGDLAKNAVQLFAVQLPFPSRSEVATSQAWARYLKTSGARLADELDVVQGSLTKLTA